MNEYLDKTKEKKPAVAVFVTGGTILCGFDYKDMSITPNIDGEKLLEALPGIRDRYDIELIEFSNVPSNHLTPKMGIELSKKVAQKLADERISGAVVVQGTDTLEEMAYLFHLTVNSEKPVVFTGSMKCLNELYGDARGNLYGAIRLAASPEARRYGVLVYLDEEILSARYASKTHSTNMASFKSVGAGTLGVIINDQVRFFSKPQPHATYDVSELKCNVQLIRSTLGMDELFIKSCIEARADGIVVEAMGSGNLPPYLVPWIEKAVCSEIPVVIVSRCSEGFATDTYADSGGGAVLRQKGAIFGGDLSGIKARIKLMVLCSVSRDISFIRDGFENMNKNT